MIFYLSPPREYVNSDFNLDNLFKTRSSGTSGKVLPIYVDSQAIIIDTLQGIRQFYLQSEGKYSKEDIIVHINTVPWLVDSIEGDYQTVFISSLISTEKIAQILRDIQPEIISLYPSNLKSLLPYLVDQQIKRNLYLIVVHSEMSSREERRLYSDIIGVPVLDEYSSEELTRIALELPCGHYHICEDTVRLDVLDPDTLKPINKGTGIAVATNLLNIAMPFIRYFQGDYISVEEEKKCNINWRQIEKVEGRVNDSFLTKYVKEIPAGTLLDITYRMMFDTGINIKEFSLIQKDYNLVLLKIYDPELQNSQEKIDLLVKKLKELLSTTFGYSVEVNLEFSESPLIKLGVSKRRVIVRDLQNK
jgi:phenylacetate-CoA ligase